MMGPRQQLVDVCRVTAEFSKLNSRIRFVVAAIAFELCVDIANVRYIIIWACSKVLLQYWRGKKADAVVVGYVIEI